MGWASGVPHPQVLTNIGVHRAGLWVVVATYGIAFVLSLGALVSARRAGHEPASVSRRDAADQHRIGVIWLAVAAVLGALLVNRQFDLLTHLIRSLRRSAYAEGWYERRREYQAAVIAGFLLAGVVLLAALAVVLRHLVRRVGVVAAATVALVVFVCIRAVSLHHVDHLLGLGGSDVVNGTIELGLLGVIIGATFVWLRDERPIGPRRSTHATARTAPS